MPKGTGERQESSISYFDPHAGDPDTISDYDHYQWDTSRSRSRHSGDPIITDDSTSPHLSSIDLRLPRYFTVFVTLNGITTMLLASLLLRSGPLAQLLLFVGFLLTALPILLHILHSAIGKEGNLIRTGWIETGRWRWAAAIGITLGIATLLAPVFLPKLLPITAAFFAGPTPYSTAVFVYLACIYMAILAKRLRFPSTPGGRKTAPTPRNRRLAWVIGGCAAVFAILTTVFLAVPTSHWIRELLIGSLEGLFPKASMLFTAFGAVFAGYVAIKHTLKILDLSSFTLSDFLILQRAAFSKMGKPLTVLSLSLAFIAAGLSVSCILLYTSHLSSAATAFFASNAIVGLSAGTLCLTGAITLLVAIPVLYTAHVLSQSPYNPNALENIDMSSIDVLSNEFGNIDLSLTMKSSPTRYGAGGTVHHDTPPSTELPENQTDLSSTGYGQR